MDFKRTQGLKKDSDFRKVYKHGKSFANRNLVMYILDNKSDSTRVGISVSKKVGNESNGRFSFIPSDSSAKKVTPAVSLNEEYTVKEGDTLESIVIRFYGSFDMDKVARIQEANKMANPNALSIGQKLVIPMNQ